METTQTISIPLPEPTTVTEPTSKIQPPIIQKAIINEPVAIIVEKAAPAVVEEKPSIPVHEQMVVPEPTVPISEQKEVVKEISIAQITPAPPIIAEDKPVIAEAKLEAPVKPKRKRDKREKRIIEKGISKETLIKYFEEQNKRTFESPYFTWESFGDEILGAPNTKIVGAIEFYNCTLVADLDPIDPTLKAGRKFEKIRFIPGSMNFIFYQTGDYKDCKIFKINIAGLTKVDF